MTLETSYYLTTTINARDSDPKSISNKSFVVVKTHTSSVTMGKL